MIPITTSNIQVKGIGLLGLITASKIMSDKKIEINNVKTVETPTLFSLNPITASSSATPPPIPVRSLIRSLFLIFHTLQVILYKIN